MKTNAIMESIDRELNGIIVKQRTKDSFFSLTSVLFVVNDYRGKNNLPPFNLSTYLKSDNVKTFLKSLEKEINTRPYIPATKSSSGWIHPYFMIKILLHNNPDFEIKIYKWLWDYLIESRIRSSDSYERMCGILFKYTSNKEHFTRDIKVLAKKIKDIIACSDWDKATALQLERRDYLLNMIADLAKTLKNSRAGVKLGLQAYFDKYSD